jgi:hypothetical protein
MKFQAFGETFEGKIKFNNYDSENEGLVEQFIEMGYFEAVEDQYVTVGYAGPQPVLRILKEN